MDYEEEYHRLKRRSYETVARWQRKNPATVLYHSARQRAAKKGLEFTITVDDIHIPEKCPIMDIPLEFFREYGANNRRKNSPSLDRIDKRRGYTPDNIRVISDIANRMKSDATPDELITFANAILQGKT
jgi:hypothetical protein